MGIKRLTRFHWGYFLFILSLIVSATVIWLLSSPGLTNQKSDFLLSSVASLLGILISILIYAWIKHWNDVVLCRSLLQNCLTETNSNITCVKNEIKKNTLSGAPEFRLICETLKNTLRTDMYYVLLNSSVLRFIEKDHLHRLLNVYEKIKVLKATLKGRLIYYDNVTNNNEAKNESQINWSSIIPQMECCRCSLDELRGYIRKRYPEAGE